MKKISIICGCIIALAAFAVWAPNAGAYSNYSGCINCHHRAANCNSCHGWDTSLPGIAEYHENNNFSSCTICHSATPDPADVDDDGDGVTENQGDCNDANPNIYPGADEVCGDGVDQDCDNADEACPPDPADVDDDGDKITENQGDCNDADASIYPGADEVCGDGVDQDCDGADEICPPDPADVDDDGDKITENQGDCNDADASIYPGADEVCGDGVDQDCDGADEICPPDPADVDDDGDGFTENQGDCNDANADIYPGAAEICDDGIDQDCNRSDLACLPDPEPDPADVDNDNDGFTENQGDCNDANADIYPGAAEICGDGTDQDCNGSDSACPPDPADVDNDHDGVTENQGDCDDTDERINPGAKEVCGDGIDQDCDGADEMCPPDPADVDNDGDGVTENEGDCNDDVARIHPGAAEICGDGIDQDCDGFDEVCPTDPADVDNDGDGATENQGDCDDTEASIFPGAAEVCGDGIDQDCDGSDLLCPRDSNVGDSEVRVAEAEWNARKSELEVEGTGAPVGAKVIITDAKTGEEIGTTAVKRNGKWKLDRNLYDSAPCRVRAEINGQYAEMDLEHAPAMCSDDDADRDEDDDDADRDEDDDDDEDEGGFRKNFRSLREKWSSIDFTGIFSRWNF